MHQSHFILSDSGGIQEEVSILGKPILVMRKTTERGEGVSEGNAKLIGVEKDTIVREASLLMDNPSHYEAMAKKHTQYGDGTASRQIAHAIAEYMATH